MSLRIITDSSSDFTLSEANELGITVIPLILSYDGNDYKDGIDITKDEFYDLLVNKKKFPKTSQPSPVIFENIFNEVKENNDDCIVITIAKALSGTYNSAILAKSMVDYDNIHIVDSCTVIAGLQLLVKEAIKLKDKGVSTLDIVNELNKLKESVRVYASMNTLEYLKNGGRLTTFEATIGTLLNLKPIISFKENGAIKIVNKPIGNSRANKQIMAHLEDEEIDDNYEVFYYYSYNDENLNNLKQLLIKNKLYKEGKTINLSPVVGCHIGDNGYGVVYIKKTKE